MTIPIPSKKYFTIGEVSRICGVKTHVLRYWEKEFPQLQAVSRRANRRYYQKQDILAVRAIKTLLKEQGYTVNGARDKLKSHKQPEGLTSTPEIDTVKELQEVLDILKG